MTNVKKPKVEEQVEEQEASGAKCVSMSFDYEQPGSRVNRWGFTWTVGDDGRALSAEIPDYAVKDGIGAGRWRAEGKSSEENDLVYWQQQHYAIFAEHAPAEMNAKQVESRVRAKINSDLSEKDKFISV